MKKAAAYARVSTLHQSGLSIEGQFETIENYARISGITIIDKFSDKDTGKYNTREEFDIMVANIKSGKYDYVLVEKFSRFTRAGVRGVVFVEDLEEQTGVQFIATLEQVDTTTRHGRATRAIKMIFDGIDREEIVERTKLRMRDTAKAGYWMGGNPPYGLSTIEVADKEGRKRKVLAINKEEAPIIHEIFSLFAEGKSTGYIAGYLADRKIRNRRGKSWAKSSILDILHNEKYIGAIVYGKGTKKNHHAKRTDTIVVHNAIEAIISKELWDKVGSRFSKRNWSPRVHYYLLSGIIKCGDCGASLVGNGSKNPSYVCSAWKNHKLVKYVGISKSKIERFVIDYIRHDVLGDMQEMNFDQTAEEMNKSAARENKSRRKQIEKLKKKLVDISSQEANILEAIKNGVSIKQIKEEANNLKVLRESIETELQELENPEKTKFVTSEELKSRWESINQKLQSGDCYQLDSVVHNLIHRVEVFPDSYIRIIEK